MYENLVAFLLGKKSELSSEEMNEFMDLLCKAMDVSEEYRAIEKQTIIENIINSVDVKDGNERVTISDAIENILMFNDSSSESQEEDLFIDKSENNEPLKSRKVKRGRFKKSKETLCQSAEVEELPKEKDYTAKEDELDLKECNPSKIFKIDNTDSTLPPNIDNIPEFDFVIGDLQENHTIGPDFDFKIDDE